MQGAIDAHPEVRVPGGPKRLATSASYAYALAQSSRNTIRQTAEILLISISNLRD
jgi:hypothetical protein